MSVACYINKPRRRTRSKLKRLFQERGHLPTGNRSMRTVPGRVGRASHCHSQHCQPFHIRRPPLVGININKPGSSRQDRIHPVQHPHQPHRHHPTLQRIVRTELARFALGPVQNPQPLQPLHTRLMRPRLMNIREPTISHHKHRRNHRGDNKHQHNHNPPNADRRQKPHKPRHPNTLNWGINRHPNNFRAPQSSRKGSSTSKTPPFRRR